MIDGKRKRKPLYAKTRAEVTNKLKDCLVAQPTVGEYLHRWVNDAATPRLRPRTLAGYKQIINSHLKRNLGGIQIKDLQDSMCKP